MFKAVCGCVCGTCRASKVLTPTVCHGRARSAAPLLMFHYKASITKDQLEATIKAQKQRHRGRSLTTGRKSEGGRKHFKVKLTAEARSRV